MRPDLPTGTVTFLFTDVEGSTKLLHELGAQEYSRVLAEHRRVLRAAFRANQGVEVDTQGDAFFVAFPTAPGAVGAAAEALDGLGMGPFRVRMGIHTGTPHLGEEGYVGFDVHRAARIAAAGHGGQVLLSQATADLAGVEVRDLGLHRLKDLSAPERIFQLGDGEFPPLKSLHRTNLPIPATAFLGRERELHDLHELVSRADVRLLTLTGPGGSGKTRLALQAAAEAAERYPGGVFWVPLAPLRDPALVLETAGLAVGARDGLPEYIGDTAVLLLFDNFEHLTEAAADVAGLLGSCPGLELLVTSREPLHVAGEQEYSVPPLGREEGVDFFLARARAVNPDFGGDDAVGEICRRLDDLPLALELAAARVKVLSPAQILERLEQRLPLLTGGARDAPERQRTLRAAIEWSYRLLDQSEQILFARLAVFVGGFTLAAAECVAEADIDRVQSLVAKSLVVYGEGRFWMLETIRELALEKLELSEDVEQLRRRHAEYLLELPTAARGWGTGASTWRTGSTLSAPESENLRAAVAWALERQNADLALGLALRAVRISPSELARLYDAALLLGGSADPVLRASALFEAAFMHFLLENHDRADTLGREALDLFRALGDELGQSGALQRLAIAALARGDQDRARALLEESLELAEAGSSRERCMALHSLGELELVAGNLHRAAALLEEALQLALEAGSNHASNIECALGNTAFEAGEIPAAESRYLSALSRATARGSLGTTGACLARLAAVAAQRGESERAGRLWGASESFRRESGLPIQAYELARLEDALASVAGAQFNEAAHATRQLDTAPALAAALADLQVE